MVKPKKKSRSSKKKKTPRTSKVSKTDKKLSRKEQIKQENKILKNILLGIGVLALIILIIVLVVQSLYSFDYRGVDFKVVREGNILLYNTQIPVISQNKAYDYNFYLRNDPRKIHEEVAFEGDLDLDDANVFIFDHEDAFVCNGYESIAVVNLVNLYKLLVKERIAVDLDATCESSESQGHMYVDLKPGEITKVVQTSDLCYDIHIKDCEVLEGTERFMIETFVKIQEELN